MRKFLLGILLALPLAAQVPCQINGQFTATGQSAVFDNRRLGCYVWVVSYNSTGFSALSVQLEEAPDNSGVPGSWAAFTGTAVYNGVNPSTNTNAATIGINSNAAWVRFNFTSKMGSGAITYQVWGANSASNTASLLSNYSPTAFVSVQNVGTDSICGKGADGTLFLDGSLKTVTVVTGVDIALPAAGTWTTMGGGGTGASGTFTAVGGNLTTVTIVSAGNSYTSNPTFVPSSGSIGTSTTAFSGCANSVNGTAETAFKSTVTVPVNTLANGSTVFKLGFIYVGSGAPSSLFFKIRSASVSGTIIYTNSATISKAGNSGTGTFHCVLTAIGAPSNSTPVIMSCVTQAFASPVTSNVTTGAYTVALPTNTPIVFVVTATFGAATAGNALILYSVSPG